jgi:hypothetical protein
MKSFDYYTNRMRRCCHGSPGFFRSLPLFRRAVMIFHFMICDFGG